jgi:hypothetical protein
MWVSLLATIITAMIRRHPSTGDGTTAWPLLWIGSALLAQSACSLVPVIQCVCLEGNACLRQVGLVTCLPLSHLGLLVNVLRTGCLHVVMIMLVLGASSWQQALLAHRLCLMRHAAGNVGAGPVHRGLLVTRFLAQLLGVCALGWPWCDNREQSTLSRWSMVMMMHSWGVL